jgi:CopG family transcriptional regulator / antitoxin EndoAI
MMKRINVLLPEETVRVLDKVARKGSRSRFISKAVLHYVEHRGKQSLRDRLKQEALENAQRDLSLAAEWFPLEEEAQKAGAATGRQPRIRKPKR